jgi:hypothetical protein
MIKTFILFVSTICIACLEPDSDSNSFQSTLDKINGVNFVAPNVFVTEEVMKPVAEVGANWISVVPYAYSYPLKPGVHFNTGHQWWGESAEGAIAQIRYAKAQGYKVMMKPHIWVIGQGWAGEYEAGDETNWRQWEKSYETYILHFARISDSMGVEMICIGTEYKVAVKERPQFWVNLIDEVRKVFNGKITYAANWDNYQNIPFWEKLDYIGIDAYFPLIEDKTPAVIDLVAAWEPDFRKIKSFCEKHRKPILFTEYGYMSIDGAAGKHWELESNRKQLASNMIAQSNAYEALFKKFWNEEWFAGGFLWKWFYYDDTAGGLEHNGFTPQNKPVEKVIRKYYTR